MLANYTTQATAAGQILFNYLTSTYGGAMTLSSSQLDSLQKSCSNCRFILGQDITLPVILDAASRGCVTPAAYASAKASLTAVSAAAMAFGIPSKK